MRRLMIEIASLAFVLIVGFVFLIVTGFVGYKIGYKRGLNDMATFVEKYIKNQESGDSSLKLPRGDDETGNVGHFGS